ncbi:unnamed protein product, partial [Tetraodon nigroviridis]
MNRIRIHVLPSSRNRVAQTLRPEEPQTCAFSQRPCSLPRLEGLEFCIKHILEDKNAPYKQCNYVSTKNGKRCPNASPKGDRKDGVTFCAEHARRNAMALRAQMRKQLCSPSPETLVSQLSGYSRPEAHTIDGGLSESTRTFDEDSLSEEEEPGPLLLDQTWRGDPESEADSIDSDHEDPFETCRSVHGRGGGADHQREAHPPAVALHRPVQAAAASAKGEEAEIPAQQKGGARKSREQPAHRSRRSVYEGEGEPEEAQSSAQVPASLRRGGPAAPAAEDQEACSDRRSCSATRQNAAREVLLSAGGRALHQPLPAAGSPLPVAPSDICQDGNQVLFKACPGTKDVPCERTVHMGQAEDPRCPLHLILPPPMFQPEQEASLPEALGAASRDMYLSAAELQPTENLPLEFSDSRPELLDWTPVRKSGLSSEPSSHDISVFQDLDVEGDGMQGPPSPLQFDTALALEDQTIRAIAEAPMDILGHPDHMDLDSSGQDLSERDVEPLTE